MSEARRRLLDMAANPDMGTNERGMINTVLSPYSDMVGKVSAFHDLFGVANPPELTMLTVSARERRLRLTFEEFAETVRASGFRFVITLPDGSDMHIHDEGSIGFYHIEGSQQDIVEIADGIADQLVTNIGHALEHGIDIDAVFGEVMCANMTKLDETGKPIINDGVIDPSKPVGKILKPATYVAPDVASIVGGLDEDVHSR